MQEANQKFYSSARPVLTGIMQSGLVNPVIINY